MWNKHIILAIVPFSLKRVIEDHTLLSWIR